MTITDETVFDDNTWGKDYTGTITDAQNNPVNGTVTLSFAGNTTAGGEFIDPDWMGGVTIVIWSNSPSEETYSIQYVWIRDDNKRAYIVYNQAKIFEPSKEEGTVLWELARANPNSTDPEVIPPTPPTPKPTNTIIREIKSVHYPTNKQNTQSGNDIERIRPMGATSDTTQTINFLVAYDTEFVNLDAQPAIGPLTAFCWLH